MPEEEIEFYFTNESLGAIVAGLEPNEKDVILAVGGSGDQAFALLEYAGKVVAVDSNRTQIEFMKRRKGALDAGDYKNFLDAPPANYFSLDFHKRNGYFRPWRLFRRNARLEIIRKRLDRLEVVEGNIFQIIQQRRGFSKIYLSNALSWPNPDRLEDLGEYLPDGCLVYASGRTFPGLQNLQRDDVLSLKAAKLEHYWLPGVFRKVAQRY